MARPRTVLITGATDGLGAALARRYAPQATLVLTGRRAASDVELPDGAAYVQADFESPVAAATTIRAALDAWNIEHLDRLVLNAGTACFGPAAAEAPLATRRVLDVNVAAPVALAHALAPRVLTAQGIVAMVGSVVSAVACPDYATYAASKAALDGFARSLRVEWRGRARVICIHPGAVRTGIHEKAGVPKERVDWTTFPSAERVAAELMRRIERAHGRRAVLGLGNRVLYRVGRTLAGPLDALMRRQQT